MPWMWRSGTSASLSDFGSPPAGRVVASPVATAGPVAPRALVPSDLGAAPRPGRSWLGDGQWRPTPQPGTNGYALGGGSFAIPDSEGLAWGRHDFTLAWQGALRTWRPPTLWPIATKEATLRGVRWSLATDGRLLLSLSDGETTTTLASTIPVPEFPANEPVQLAVAVDRAGDARFYVEGTPLGDPVSVASFVDVDLTNSGPLRWHSDGTTPTPGEMRGGWVYGHRLDSDDLRTLVSTGRATPWLQGSFANGLSFPNALDETAVWERVGLAVTTNTTDAPDGSPTADALVAHSGTGGHYLRRVAGTGVTRTGGCRFELAAYAKAGPGGRYVTLAERQAPAWQVVTFDLQEGTVAMTAAAMGAGVLRADIRAVGGGWYRLRMLIRATSGLLSQPVLALTNAATNSTGEPSWSATGGETVFAWGLSSRAVGAVVALEPEGVQPVPGQWLDGSGGRRHALASGDAHALRPVRRGQTRGRTSTHGSQQLAGGACLPAGARIGAIVAHVAAGTPTVQIGSFGGGAQIAAAQTLAGGRNDIALAGRYSSSGSVWVQSDTTTAIDWTVLWEVVD